MQLIESQEMFERERMDKEHTAIAYKRFLRKIEKEKQHS
jgi:hypothetical protein